jgi:GT2 family glycosyltransferase
MYRLQQLVMPNLTFGAPDEMYFRLANNDCRISFEKSCLLFSQGGRFSSDTFFNGLSVGVWKKHCQIEALHLVLTGKGKFILRFGLYRIGHTSKWLSEHQVDLNCLSEVVIDVSSWQKLEAGLLYFALDALEDNCELLSGYFGTTSLPKNKVKLGIVITHFNRKQFVVPAIKRVSEELLIDPLYVDKVNLIVVDNSQNITDEEAAGITLIPNDNFGGAGGFARGLLYVKDDVTFTHCLFMDDDASCEVESIRRTLALLEYSVTPKFSVAGALLRELEPYRLHEKGATFDGACRPLKHGLDMRDVNHLLLAEIVDVEPHYGAWWFFAFAIKDVQNYPFPFFVRGDDCQFGSLNHFSVCTMNGISSWGDDFALKSGAMTMYLDARHHLLNSMFLLETGFGVIISTMIKLFLGQLFSYNYASAHSMSLAFAHIMKGPKFWVDNIDMSKIREEISSYASSEKMVKVDRARFEVSYAQSHESMTRKLVRLFTLNGMLLPSFMIKKGVVFQHKNFRGVLKEIFRYKEVLYKYEPTGVGYVAEHNKKKFFGELALFSWQMVKFIVCFSALKREYQQALPDMTSESFWRKVYKAKE